MRADHDDVVRVAVTRLGDHLRQEAIRERAVDLEVDGRIQVLLVGLQQVVAERVARDHRSDRRRRGGLVVDEDRILACGRVALVVDDDAGRAGRLGQRPLLDEGARTALDERDLAGHAGVVGGQAAAGRSAGGRIDDSADGEHGSVGEHHGRRVRHRDEVRRRQVAVVGIAGDVGLRRRRDHVQDRWLRLAPDRKVELVDLRLVAGRLQRRHDVVERLLVAGREHLACVVVERGDRLQRGLVLHDLRYGDAADEPFRFRIFRADAVAASAFGA